MNAVIVTIGDEILIGQIVDTNSAWIAEKLTEAGIRVREIVSISDDPSQIRHSLDRWVGKSDVIIVTGGLGPTKDDLTKQTITEYFGGKLVMNEEVLGLIEEFFKKRGHRMIESNRLQAMLPDNCKVLPNYEGTAQGMWFNRDQTEVFSIPGVPFEMKPIIEQSIIPELKKISDVSDIVHRTVMTQGIAESYLADRIADWESSLPECLKLAYLPRPGIVRLRLTATGDCHTEPLSLIEEKIAALREIIPEYIYGYENEDIHESLAKVLLEKGLTVATAESCTGGEIAHRITTRPGSSAYFLGGVVAYSNPLKTGLLGVKEDILERYGAVSREVVVEMAEGAMKQLGADTSVAVSGIAGPDGGTEEKPVGTVWIAVGYQGETRHKKFVFGGDRERVIEQATIASLSMLRKLLIGID